jgi:hypothetical protein
MSDDGDITSLSAAEMEELSKKLENDETLTEEEIRRLQANIDELGESVTAIQSSLAEALQPMVDEMGLAMESFVDVVSTSVAESLQDMNIEDLAEASIESHTTPEFGPCQCSSDEEDWRVEMSPHKDDIDTDALLYKCYNCGDMYQPFAEEQPNHIQIGGDDDSDD